MKKGILFQIFLFCAMNICYAQKPLRVEYEMVKTVNVANLPISNEAKAKLQEQLKKPEKQFLYYYKGDSFYTNGETVAAELSRNEQQISDNTKAQSVVKLSPQVSRYYRTADSNGLYVYHSTQDEEFYELYTPTWKNIEYKKETQKIDNFECKLAEVTTSTDRIIKIWYTEQIPVNIGPSWYYNFPGLVLKVEAPDFTIYATKVSNNTNGKEVEKPNPKLKVYAGKEWELKSEQIKKQKETPTVIKKSIQL